MDSGGGQQQQPTSTSTTTSNIPDWAIPFATKNLGKAEALTDINQNPYQTYQGNRVADFNPLQQQAFSNVSGMQTNAGTGNAMNQTQDAYNRSANAGQYNAQNFGNQYGSGPQFQNMGLGYLAANAPQLNQYGMGPAQQVRNLGLNQYQMGPADQINSQNFNQQFAQDYISPYQQNVTDFQKDEAVRDYSRQLPGMGAKAAGAGAFGGTRHALVASEGQRNLQNQLGGIQAAGSQNAYQNAQQQFNADQARRQQAQLANQQAGLTTGQANLGSALQTQALGAGQNMQAQLANQQAGLTVGQQNLASQLQTQALGSGQSMQAQLANQGAYGQMQGLGMQQNLSANQQAMQNAQQRAQYGLAGQQAGEQSRQFGANYGLQNRQQALAAAGQLGTLGQQQYAQQMGINSAQQQAGAQMQAQEQQGLSNKYQDFLNQQNYPYKQLGFMSDIMRGTPTSGGAQSMYQAPPSGVSQLAGLGGGLGSLFGAYNAANRVATGGEIKGYAEGGTVALAEGGPTYGDVAPLPGIAALMAAKNINAGKATVDEKLGLGADLRGLLMASMQLKKQKEEDTIRGLQNQLAQATGMPSQQNTTVKEDVVNMLRQEVESSAAENAPEAFRQGGIAELDTGNLGENYNSGGIVAFSGKDNDQEVEEKMAAEQTISDRKAIADAIKRLGVAGLDIATLPGRALAGVYETAVTRPLNAIGVSHPYLPKSFYGGDATSMTPYYDKLRAEEAPPKPNTGDMYESQARAAVPVAPPANVGIKTPSPAAPAASSAPASTFQSEYDKLLAGIGGQGGKTQPTAKTLQDTLTETETARAAYLKSQGLESEGQKERIDELKGQALQARNDRDVDRWMAAAEGFFAMGVGDSQYAMQNISRGLGLGTKQLQSVEKEYRAGEKARLDSIAALKQSQRAEKLGLFDQAVKFQEKREDLEQKRVQHEQTVRAQLAAIAERIVSSDKNNATQLAVANISAKAQADNRPFNVLGELSQRYEAIKKLPPEQQPAAMKEFDNYQKLMRESSPSAYATDTRAGTALQISQLKGLAAKEAAAAPTINGLMMGNAKQKAQAKEIQAGFESERRAILSSGAAPAADNMTAADKILSGT